MAHWEKVPATKPSGLSSTLENYLRQESTSFLSGPLFFDLHSNKQEANLQ